MNMRAEAPRYRQVARADARQRTRDALLDAASRQFLAKRWDLVTLDTLAGEAGVTKQTLLRHFGSKTGLLEQAVNRGYEQVRGERFGAPRGDVGAAVDNLLDHYETWGALSLRVGGTEGESPVLDDLAARARRLHHEWIDHAFGPQLEALDGVARERCRHALIAICDLHAWRVLARDLGLPRREVRATLMEAIERLTGSRP